MNIIKIELKENKIPYVFLRFPEKYFVLPPFGISPAFLRYKNKPQSSLRIHKGQKENLFFFNLLISLCTLCKLCVFVVKKY